MTFRLGLRLAVAGGRESLLRLAVTAFGVAVGVVLLLLCLTGQSAEQGRAERSGWQSAESATPATAPDPALFLTVTDYHEGTAMIRGSKVGGMANDKIRGMPTFSRMYITQ